MWHRVDAVAKTWRFDDIDFVEFAEANADRFGIVNEFGHPEVNTWYANELIEAYKEKLQRGYTPLPSRHFGG